MIELIKKARATLNILLLGSIILAWSSYKNKTTETTSKYAKEIYEICVSEGVNLPPNSRANFFVQEVRRRAMNDLDSIGSIPIYVPISIEDDQMFLMFSLKPQVSNEASFEALNNIEDQLVNETDVNSDKAKTLFKLMTTSSKTEEERQLRMKIGMLKDLLKQTKLSNETRLNDVDEKLKSFIKLPFVNENVETGLAVVLMSFFIVGPLLLFFSTVKTISNTPMKLDEGVFWVFFHSGKLGLILGMAQLYIPFAATIYVLITGSMNRIYILSIMLIVLFLSTLCSWEVLKARRKFYTNLNGQSVVKNSQESEDSL